MFTIDAHNAAGHIGLAAARRDRVAEGMYPCGWLAGDRVPSTHESTSNFTTTISHKAWRPKESSP